MAQVTTIADSKVSRSIGPAKIGGPTFPLGLSAPARRARVCAAPREFKRPGWRGAAPPPPRPFRSERARS